MRARPTFQSVMQGIDPPLVKYKHFPSLELLRSPSYNVFYDAAVNMRDQSIRIQRHQAEEREFDAAATSSGVSMHAAKAQAKQKQQNEKDVEMADAHFAVLQKQDELMQQTKFAKQLEQLDLQKAQGMGNLDMLLGDPIPMGMSTGLSSASSSGPQAFNVAPQGMTFAQVSDTSMMPYIEPQVPVLGTIVTPQTAVPIDAAMLPYAEPSDLTVVAPHQAKRVRTNIFTGTQGDHFEATPKYEKAHALAKARLNSKKVINTKLKKQTAASSSGSV
jgi:hypothetical protein